MQEGAVGVNTPLPEKWSVPLRLGFSVIPVEPSGKKPLAEWKTFMNERADADTVARWAANDSNVGIITGKVSGVVVLDFDDARAETEAKRRGLPETVTAKTSRGRHYFFNYPDRAIRKPKGFPSGMDVQSDHKFVVAPGSLHPSGTVYEWENDPDIFPLADLPDWLLEPAEMPAPGAVERDPEDDEVIPTPKLLDELRDALSAIDADERELWIRMGMALKTLPDEKGKSLWIDWSKKSKKYDAADAERVWESFRPTGSGYKAIFAEARDNWNWGNPASREVASNAIEGEVLEGAEVSEDAIALAFTARYRDTLRYDHDADSWFEWDGGRWRRDGRQRAFHYAREASRILGEGKRAMCKAIVANGVEKFAKAHPAHAMESSDWDCDPMLLGTPGGTVDLTTGELRTPDPKHLITKQTSTMPETGEPGLWLRFLNEALAGDAEAIHFLQRWAGYCLTGDTREHALLFLHGPGGTGKSVFLNTLARVLGDYAVTASMETFTASKYERHPADLAMLRGARLVTASETEEGRHWAEAKIKQITGGDPITARFMRQNFFTYSPQFKLTIIGNHAPRLTSPDDAMRRRFNILGFNVKPSNPDSQLEEKLQPEHGRILQWAIEGCLDWQLLGGLACPDAVIKATEEYFQEQDLFGQWLEQACTQSAGRRESSKALYEDWAAFARHAGDDPGSQCSFSDRLKSRGFIRKKVGGVAYYQGLELKFEEENHV
jgi:P4 family phage/plasmid primase-like protien